MGDHLRIYRTDWPLTHILLHGVVKVSHSKFELNFLPRYDLYLMTSPLLSSPLLSSVGQQVFLFRHCSRSTEWSLWVRHSAGSCSSSTNCHPGGPTQPDHPLHLLSRGQLFPSHFRHHCAQLTCQIWSCQPDSCFDCLTAGNLRLHWQFEDGVWYAEQSVCLGPGQCSLSTGDWTGVHHQLGLHRLTYLKGWCGET